jgi:hypothetical protein
MWVWWDSSRATRERLTVTVTYGALGRSHESHETHGRLLGYIDPASEDDDAADAAAIFDFASSHFAGKASGFALIEQRT